MDKAASILSFCLKIFQWLATAFFILGVPALLMQGHTLAAIGSGVIAIVTLPPASMLWSKVPVLSKAWGKILVILVLIVLSGTTMPKVDKPENKVTLNQPEEHGIGEVVLEETPIRVISSSNIIAGLSPVDVYGNFEKKGFVVEKRITEKTASWTCTDTDNGIEYTVEVYSIKDVGQVSAVEYTALRVSPEKNGLEDMKAFLKYGASLPYDGADPNKVAQFIDDNYSNSESRVIIGGVKFTLYAPSEYSRILSVEPQ